MSEAHEAIRNLLGRYCALMDAAQWAAVGELFAEAALIGPTGQSVAEGSHAVEALYRNGTKLHNGTPATRHITANTVIEVDGDTATASSSYVVFQGVHGFPLRPIITGRYEDSFRCVAGRWRFARRQFFVDHVEDLSHHLTYEVP